MARITKADLLNEREVLVVLLAAVVHGYDVMDKFSGSRIPLHKAVEDVRAVVFPPDKG